MQPAPGDRRAWSFICIVLATASSHPGGRGKRRPFPGSASPSRSCAIGGESPTSMLETNTTCSWRRASAPRATGSFNSSYGAGRPRGRLAEIEGPRALLADVGARLLRFRGDMKRELNHYHPRGYEIVTAFVEGINAYIELTEREPARLPLEFRILGMQAGQMDAGGRRLAAQRAVSERDPGGAKRPARSVSG